MLLKYLYKQVNLKEWCGVGAGYAKAKEFPPVSAMNLLKGEFKEGTGIIGIHFASNEGVFIVYPGLGLCSDTFDPRYRLEIFIVV